ncbi:MAG: phosphate regulon sensor histidine kinase PhoR [Methylohalobius crimeensis]
MRQALRSEFRLFTWGLTAALLIGWLEDYPLTVVGLFFLAHLIRHLYYSHALLSWVQGREKALPEGNGMWTEVFHRLRLMQRRHQRRKRRLGKILKRFRQATEALPDATVVLTDDFEIEWFNKAAARLLGFQSRDKGLRVDGLIRHPGFVEHLQQRRFDQSLTISAPDSERTQLEIRIVSYMPDRYLLLAQDVTQIRLLERQRRDFVAHVSHELRTPLTVLKGYLETLEDAEAAVTPPFQPLLQRMDEQIRRLQYLIDDLLYLSRLETTKHTPTQEHPVDVARLLSDICDEVDQFQGQHPAIQVRIESEKFVLGNEQELRSAFTNLVVNAVKYTPATGRIAVRWYDTDQGVCLEVADTGPGIPAEHIPRLTERFYRVPEAELRNATGTGLGLAIVKHVLNRHKGRLEIESQFGRGSAFRCHFPQEQVARGETLEAS